jgi:phage/plasmid-associated DNA primase
VILTEPGDQAGNPNTIKQVLGGDQISARNVFGGETINFRSYAKILIPSNEIFNVAPGPAMTDVKVVYVEFKAFFTSNPDPNKPNQFKEDPTLEAWLESAEGKACFVKYLINQYSPELLPVPYCVAKFHKMVVADGETSAETFIKEFLIATEAGRGNVTAEATYNKYTAWCANKLKKVSCKQRDFSQKITSLVTIPPSTGLGTFPVSSIKRLISWRWLSR